jgi:hypothetical protein
MDISGNDIVLTYYINYVITISELRPFRAIEARIDGDKNWETSDFVVTSGLFQSETPWWL